MSTYLYMSLWAYLQKFLVQGTCVFFFFFLTCVFFNLTIYGQMLFQSGCIQIHTFTHHTVLPGQMPHQIFPNAYCPNLQILFEAVFV